MYFHRRWPFGSCSSKDCLNHALVMLGFWRGYHSSKWKPGKGRCIVLIQLN